MGNNCCGNGEPADPRAQKVGGKNAGKKGGKIGDKSGKSI